MKYVRNRDKQQEEKEVFTQHCDFGGKMSNVGISRFFVDKKILLNFRLTCFNSNRFYILTKVSKSSILQHISPHHISTV